MTQKWSDRPKANLGMIIGAFVGMAIATGIVFSFALGSGTIVRYLIMAAGLLIGAGAGIGAASLTKQL